MCVRGRVFLDESGLKERGKPADNGLHFALPLSPSVCLVLAFRFFFNLSLLLCGVEVRLAQAGVVVSRRAGVCVSVRERRTVRAECLGLKPRVSQVLPLCFSYTQPYRHYMDRSTLVHTHTHTPVSSTVLTYLNLDLCTGRLSLSNS